MPRLITAWLTACALGVSCAGQEVTATLPLHTGDGCYVSPTGAGLWESLLRAGQGHALYMEAEAAQALKLQKGRRVGRDPECAGRAYLAHVTHAEFPLQVVKGAAYQGWARTFLPRPGSWNHKESMDGGRQRRVSESEASIFGRWFWSKLGSYHLRPGAHRFVLHSWLGGARLDAIIFSADPAFSPEGFAGRPRSGPHANQGTVTTCALAPPGVAQWRRLHIDGDPAGGRITAEVSTDAGAHWTACTQDGDLTGLAAAGRGTDSLIARVTLAAAKDGAGPRLRSVRATYALKPDAEVTLGNRHYTLAVARYTGRLCGIFNRSVSTPATPAHGQEPLLQLAIREPGENKPQDVLPDQIALTGVAAGARTLTLHYAALAGRVRIRVDMTADDSPLCRWRCSVANDSDRDIVRLDFPLLRNVAIGEPEDDECVIPRTGGWRIKTPASSKSWKTTYMGGGSMSWMDLCDPRAGLYVAMLDRKLTSTEMECSPSPGGRGADLTFRTHTLIRPGQRRSRDYVVGVHEGDWHWAADRYREWAYSWMKHPQSPEWVKWCDGWVHATGKTKFESMAGLTKRSQKNGLGYLQYWGHMSDGVNQCCGNFYWPAPALGGAEGFARGVADVHAQGGRVTAYMNCQTWTRDSATNDALRLTPKSALPPEALALIHPLSWFEKWRLRRFDGSAQGYYASTLGWYIMCPASKGFQEHLRFWIVDMYCKRFGTDGVYLDQTGATAAKPCYDLDHGHDDIGAWGAGNTELLARCLAEARQSNPDFIMAIEGAGDALGQYADLHLISGLCTDPEVYHYTFPDHILISGFSNRSHLSHEQRVSRAFLNGDRFDVWAGRPLVQSALRLRRRIRRWLYPARFMDTVGLRVSDDRVLARWHWCDRPGERAIVVTVDNEHKVADAKCRLDLPARWRTPGTLHVFDREGGVTGQRPSVHDGQITFAVPSSTLSTALAMYETQPANRVDAWCAVRSGPTGADTVVLGAANYSVEPVRVKTELDIEAPLSVGQGPTELDVPGAGARQWELRLAGVDGLTQPKQVAFCVTWPAGRIRHTATVRPLLVNGTMAMDEDGDGAPDHWRPGGTTVEFLHGVEGGACWIQGRKSEFLYQIQMVPLEANTKYYFAGRIRRSAATKQVSIAVVEFVGERGYRVHKLGGDEKLPANEWRRFETTLTTGASFRKCAVYLYNTHSDVRAWYDDIELRRVK